MTSDFVVHYFQLNAGLDTKGDCAVALLLKQRTDAEIKKDNIAKLALKAAVLIDCGQRINVPECLGRMIQRWKNDYYIPQDREFRFDAVVLSHWDGDHYGGFCYFVADNTRWIFDKDGVPTKFKHFKYDQNGAPLTRLYSLKPKGNQMGTKTTCRLHYQGVATTDNLVKFHIKVSGKSGLVKSNDAMIACKPVNDNSYDPVIGRNVFTGNALSLKKTEQSMDIHTLQDLVAKNDPGAVPRANGDNYYKDPNLKPSGDGGKVGGTDGSTDDKQETWDGAPGLYIIGLNRRVFKPPIQKLGAVNKTADKDDGNQQSIVMLLVWPTSFRVSLYTAGDAEWFIEDQVADFLASTTVKVAKLGHHGSAAGTSTSFVSRVKPSYAVISAGTEHGHPVPEVLLYLDAWYGSQTTFSNLNDDKKPLRSVNYPYHLGCVNDPNYSSKPRFFRNRLSGAKKLTDDEKNPLWSAWRQSCQDLWKASNRKNYITDWTEKIGKVNALYKPQIEAARKGSNAKKQLKADRDTAVAQLIAPELTSIWEDWSPVTFQYYPERAYDLDNDRLPLPQLLLRMDAMKVILTADEASDAKSWLHIDRQDSLAIRLSLSATKRKKKKKRSTEDKEVLAKSSFAPVTMTVRDPGRKRRREDDDDVPMEMAFACLALSPNQEDAVVIMSDDISGEDGEEPGDNEDTNDTGPNAVQTVRIEAMTVADNAPVPLSWSSDIIKFDKLYRSDTTPPDPGVPTLWPDPDSDADYFMSGLKSHHLTFTPQDDPTPSGYPWASSIDLSDPLMEFLDLCFDGPITLGGLKFSGGAITAVSGSNYKTTITEVELSLSMSSVNLIFSSHASNIIAGLKLTANDSSPDDSSLSSTDFATIFGDSGFMTNSKGVIVGLATDEQTINQATCSMSDIFEFIQCDFGSYLRKDTELQMVDSGSGKNAVWINVGASWTICSQFTFKSVSANSWLAFDVFEVFGLTLSGWTLFVAKQSRLQQLIDSNDQNSDASTADTTTISANATSDYAVSNGTLTIRASATIQDIGNPFDTYISLGNDKMTLILRWNGSSNPLSTLFAWLKKKSSIDIESTWSVFSRALDVVGKSFLLRQFAVSVSRDPITGDWNFQDINMTFELELEWGVDESKSDSGSAVPIMLTFAFSQKGGTSYVQMHGGLWPHPENLQRALRRLSPTSAGIPDLYPSIPKPQYDISLTRVLGTSTGSSNFPNWLPVKITTLELDFTYELASDTITLTFTGGLSNGLQTPPQSPPAWLSISNIGFRAMYTYTTVASALDLQLDAAIILTPRDGEPVARLNILIAYDRDAGDSGWVVQGDVMNVNFGMLYSFFSDVDNEAVMDIMQEINILLLEIEFDTTQNTQTFNASGGLLLGPVALDFVFNYGRSVGDGSNWEFFAEIGDSFEETTTTVGEFLGSISSFLAESLPDIISNIGMSVLENCHVRLDLTKVAVDTTEFLSDSDKYMLFSLRVTLGDLEFSFVQITKVYQAPGEASEDAPATVPPPTKRIFKATLDKLPTLSIPMIDTFTQPFDQIDFIWLSHDLTREEVETINAKTYIDRTDKLVFDDPRLKGKMPSTNQQLDVVMTAGCHFMVVVEQNNLPTPVIDYTFDAPSRNGPPVNREQRTNAQSTALLDAGSNGNQAATAKWTKTIGPLSISAISLKYENDYLKIMLDGSVALGSISANITGLGFGLPLANLPRLSPPGQSVPAIQIYFSGIGLELDTPMVKLAGELVKRGDNLEGGISVEIKPYTILAGGGYYRGFKDSATGETFDSTFIFAELKGPLVELEFASINDLTGGVGVNSNLLVPALDQVTAFPFIDTAKVDTKSSDKISILDILNAYISGKWITPQNRTTWIAGGVGVKAFQTLEIKAVVVIDIAEDPRFSVYADIVAKVPSGISNDAELFARVDMAVIAELSPHEGTFLCHGQLTPNSFILSSDCHLTGGFALYYWFAGSGHEGDWVFTVGGYHSQFVPPAWYPRPERVSITWKYSNEISIIGNAFFAITPKVCMGGGDLQVYYNSGNLSASLKAWADFLVNYRPFFFMASVGVTVGASYTVHVAWGSKTFSVHIGCSLDLHGPPLAGIVHVDWHIFAFDVHFGQANPPVAALTWSQFCDLIRQGDTPTVQDKNYTQSGQLMHTISITSGAAASQSPGPVNVDSVDTISVNGATFAFRMDTKIPITDVYFRDNHIVEDGPVYIKPMHVTSSIKSELTISIDHDADFHYIPILKEIPKALWESYDSAKDPSQGASGQNLRDLLNSKDATLRRVMGIDFVTAIPEESTDLLQFNIEYGSSYPAAKAELPNSFSTGVSNGDAHSLDRAINISVPMIPLKPYPPLTVLSRIQMPVLAKNDWINSWITWSDLPTDATLATSLRDLRDTTDVAPVWIKELSTAPTMPLPVLTAEASVKALMDDGTRFASFEGYQGTAGRLNRDWMDGGWV